MSHYSLGKHGSVTKPTPNENNSFERAVISNMKESIEKHLSHVKIDQNQLNHALMLSIDNFRLEEHADQCVLILLRHKANPNQQVDFETPLTAACKKGQQLLVKTLIQYGAKADLCNSKGQHPLQIILFDRRQNYDVALTLINALPSVNIDFRDKPSLVLAVEQQFVKIYQMLIEKGASLIYDSENILHIILKKKFKKICKKKKFLKELAGRIYLVQPDSWGKLPIEYEENEEIQTYCLEIFKPKINPKTEKENNTGTKVKTKQPKESIHKESETSLTSAKKKTKDLDISFSEVDDEDYQDQKGEGAEGEKKLTQVIQIPEEDLCEDKRQSKEIEKQKNNKQNKSSEQIKLKEKETQKSLSNNSDICLEQIQTNSTKFVEEEKEKITKKFPIPHTQVQKTNISHNQLVQAKKVPKKYYKKNSQEDLIGKNLIKRKYSSIEEELNTNSSMKMQKNRKKNYAKKQLQEEQVRQREKQRLQKDRLQKQLMQLEEEQKRIISSFQKIQKVDKQSETDSEESYQGDINSLSQQIFTLVNKITKSNQEKQELVRKIIDYLQTSIRHELEQDKKQFRLDIFVYGSQATCLAVEHSDVDLLLVSDFDGVYLMTLLEDRKVLELADIVQAKFIMSATMPVIKIRMSQKYQNMNVDLTFQTKSHMGIKCSQTIQAFMQAEPVLRPLVLVIKTLVHRYGLSDPYKGGISSYGITLMVIALLQFTEKEKKRQESIGQLLLNFFYFYGIQLDYICQAIIVHELGYSDQPLYSIYRLPYLTDLNPKLIIYDPLNPVNNVGRTTYRISALKKLFSISYFRLKGNPPCHLASILDGSFIQLVEQH